MIIWTSGTDPVGCAYPLDDDGTVAASYGYGYAGPAVGPAQLRMQYTTTGSATVKLLLSSGFANTGRFSRASTVIGYEALAVSAAGANFCGAAIAITDSGGAIINAGTINSAADNDLMQFEIAPDGTVSGFLNGAAYSFQWLYPAGQKTVGATDKFAPYLWVNDSVASELADVILTIKAADMTGTYPSDATDVCGNPI